MWTLNFRAERTPAGQGRRRFLARAPLPWRSSLSAAEFRAVRIVALTSVVMDKYVNDQSRFYFYSDTCFS